MCQYGPNIRLRIMNSSYVLALYHDMNVSMK